MKLKFIGANGSMGLEHGKIYDCSFGTGDGYIWVTWTGGRWDIGNCPYSSLKNLLENWCDA